MNSYGVTKGAPQVRNYGSTFFLLLKCMRNAIKLCSRTVDKNVALKQNYSYRNDSYLKKKKAVVLNIEASWANLTTEQYILLR